MSVVESNIELRQKKILFEWLYLKLRVESCTDVRVQPISLQIKFHFPRSFGSSPSLEVFDTAAFELFEKLISLRLQQELILSTLPTCFAPQWQDRRDPCLTLAHYVDLLKRIKSADTTAAKILNEQSNTRDCAVGKMRYNNV